MQRRGNLTVFLGKVFIVALVGSLHHLTSDGSLVLRNPTIEQPIESVLNVAAEKPLVIPCEADPGYPDDFTLVYWLIDKQFVEIASPDGRIVEEEERTINHNDKTFIQRNLSFGKVDFTDFASNFTCVVTSPSGVDMKTVQLNNISRRIYVKRRLTRMKGKGISRRRKISRKIAQSSRCAALSF